MEMFTSDFPSPSKSFIQPPGYAIGESAETRRDLGEKKNQQHTENKT